LIHVTFFYVGIETPSLGLFTSTIIERSRKNIRKFFAILILLYFSLDSDGSVLSSPSFVYISDRQK
jgi:hypothetical protein